MHQVELAPPPANRPLNLILHQVRRAGGTAMKTMTRDEAGVCRSWIRASSKRQQQITVVDCASAFVVFKVDYEQARSLAAGKAVHSDAVSAGGHMWRINFYADGMRETVADKSCDRHCIALELLSKVGCVSAMFDVTVLDDQGRPALHYVRRTEQLEKFYGAFAWFFSPRGEAPAVEQFKKYVRDGGFIKFLCTIRVLDDNPIPVPPSDIAKHLRELLHADDGTADVSFTVDGETFLAHRAVVAARSPVLRAELMDESTMPFISLHGIAPATFKAVLRFMYTDTLTTEDVDGDDDDLGGSPTAAFERLLAAADRYGLDRLKLLCAQNLWDNVSVDTVASTLACAEMYGCPELKAKCIGFFAQQNNFKKAVLTVGFVLLVQQFPSIIIELRDSVPT